MVLYLKKRCCGLYYVCFKPSAKVRQKTNYRYYVEMFGCLKVSWQALGDSVLLNERKWWCIVRSCSDSQFEDKHNICAVLVHVMQRYNVGVLELLQDVHFPLNLLSSYTTSADSTLALLDELGCIFNTWALLYAALNNCKLPTADTKEKENRHYLMLWLKHCIKFCFFRYHKWNS